MGGRDVGAACETEHARIRQPLARRLSSAEPEMSYARRASRGCRRERGRTSRAKRAVRSRMPRWRRAETEDSGTFAIGGSWAVESQLLIVRERSLADGEQERGCNAVA
jgi:hypothetical protein